MQCGTTFPADCASRGLSPKELVNHPLWWQGPTWLRAEAGSWPTAWDHDGESELPEQRSWTHAATTTKDESQEPEMLSQYSTLHRLLRVTAWCRRWRCRPLVRLAPEERANPAAPRVLRASEVEEARLTWIRAVQAVNFKEELAAIAKGNSPPTRSTLTPLTPFRDTQRILRVGGRIKHSLLSFDAKHPIILPGRSTFTRLVIEACHRRTLHGGVQLTLGSIRQDYWIPRGRALVKGCIHRCLTCLRWRAATLQPLMGDLPRPRVTPARPFLHTGVDYAGPMWLRTSKGRGQRATKAFLVVFVCLSTRAVHLDVASDYSADAFLAALRRFIARRGLCRALYSDCGTNFVGADTQLRALFAASDQKGRRIGEGLAAEKIEWHFNPPAAPNFGGLWEAAVKAAKHHLRRVIGDARLTFEKMATLLAQIESCLNSRPLQALSDDPEDFEALTPGHFLVGTALHAVLEPSLAMEAPTRLSRWQHLQQLRDHFWSRWTREYLQSLTHRPKWCKADGEVSEGRLCLLKCETTPPNKWPLARIERVHPGEDGVVRVVRTATSSFKRPLSKIILLPVCTAPEDDA
ncbi:uncharacterized protein LOC115237167 [Formica exsecta]|uniref:uncharacterized protein LOC115237167 n=1 Tax=Formica exsecta TaxID=72781 RepID=UPI001143197C|nr:uncharacterized protein LOC115237167 [Formica exsecta]